MVLDRNPPRDPANGNESKYGTIKGTLQNGEVIKLVPSYYTPAQVYQWLSCIGYLTKSDITETDISSGTFLATLENLGELMRLQLLAFPFENTPMHYTSQHMMDISHEGAFKRLVTERKGSYCYGLNGVFLGMIRGLGYRAYPGAARVCLSSDGRTFTPPNHMVIFVQPHENSNRTYLVDVGFGLSGLARPMLLSDADDNVVMGANPTEKHRLTRKPHPLSSIDVSGHPDRDRSDLHWNLEVWYSTVEKDTTTPWRCIYSFREEESFDIDMKNASFAVSTRPMGIFWENVFVVKHVLLSEARELDLELILPEEFDLDDPQYTENEKKTFMYRYVMLGKEVKRYIGGSGVIVRTMNTELERIEALREIFRLNLPDDASQHIEGRAAALDTTHKSGIDQFLASIARYFQPYRRKF